jgi:hypothetical protein
MVVVPAARPDPAVAAVTATAETEAASAASRANLVKRMWCYLLKTLVSVGFDARG